MRVLYNFPKAAAFESVIAKSKIYEYASPGTKVKDLFVREVEKIIWAYKLSPKTINLPASEGVQELQVFVIKLKEQKISQDVLQTIDKAIPSPIIFALNYNDKTQYAAAYKRPSEADKSKWVISTYFKTEWMPDTVKKAELPVTLNMGALYHSLLKAMISLQFRPDETLDELVSRVDLLRAKEREVEKLSAKLKKEKKNNRKVELNRSLNTLKQEIQRLKL